MREEVSVQKSVSRGTGRVPRLVLIAALVVSPGVGWAAEDVCPHVLIRHEGSTDPTTEGWRRVRIRNGTIAEGPVEQDAVGGVAAWRIDDDGTGQAPVALSYQRSLHGLDLHNVDTGRWYYTMCLRVVETPLPPSFSVCGEVATSTRRYMLRFNADAEGDTVVTLGLRGPIRQAKVPGTGYHRYVMRFDPAAGEKGSVSLFVDGATQPAVSGYEGEDGRGLAPRLVWGSNQSATSGHGHYNLVEFAMEKEPAAELELPEAFVAVDNVCAWPNLTVLPDGAIVAVIYSMPSHGGGEGDAQCWASEDEGKTWSLRGVPAEHEPGTCRMNLAAGLARNGDLLVLCSGWDKRDMAQDRHTRILKPWVSRSADGGRTWDVSTAFPREENMSEFIPFGDIIQARDGSLCVSAYAQTPGSKEYTYHSYFLRSTDDGRSWRRVSVIAEDHNETALLQLPDGPWLAAARIGPMDLYRSTDNGVTWEQVGRTAGSQHPGHFLRLSDGRILLTHGDRRPGIEGVGVRISRDGGATWTPYSRPVARSLHGDCGYPSTVRLPDGRLLTAYYSKQTATHPRYHMGVVFWRVEDAFGEEADRQ